MYGGYTYRIVASTSLSCFEAHTGLFRLLMKGIFYPYVLWPFDKMLISELVLRISIRNFTIYNILSTILQHFNMIKSSFSLLLVDGTLHWGMYPTGKVAISWHLVTPGFPRCDHIVGKLSANAELEQTFWPLIHPQMSAFHLLGLHVTYWQII